MGVVLCAHSVSGEQWNASGEVATLHYNDSFIEQVCPPLFKDFFEKQKGLKQQTFSE